MPTWLLIVIIVVVCVGGGIAALYFFGKKAQDKQAKQEEDLKKNAQPLNFYIIDKKKMFLKDSGLPKIVIDNMPKRAKIMKLPILKVKASNRVLSLMCDREVYKTLLPKQEVKAMVSGIYVVSAKRVRGPQLESTKKRGKDGKVKQSFIDRLR